MHSLRTFCLLVAAFSWLEAETPPTATWLKIGVVQMAQAATITANRDRIVGHIAEVAAGGARVAVFPENVLMGEGENDPEQVEAGVESIRVAARQHAIYVLFGGRSAYPPRRRLTHWLYVVGPDGRDVLRYDKLFDQPQAPMPGVFAIDGVPCGTYLCADRWLRGVQEIPVQQGARISFELSCNFANEWVAPFEWYWNVPQALRNNVWVVFANTGNTVSGPNPHYAQLLASKHPKMTPWFRLGASLLAPGTSSQSANPSPSPNAASSNRMSTGPRFMIKTVCSASGATDDPPRRRNSRRMSGCAIRAMRKSSSSGSACSFRPDPIRPMPAWRGFLRPATKNALPPSSNVCSTNAKFHRPRWRAARSGSKPKISGTSKVSPWKTARTRRLRISSIFSPKAIRAASARISTSCSCRARGITTWRSVIGKRRHNPTAIIYISRRRR